MPDEQRTLLKIDGDASGAKKAAEEVSKAIGQTAESVQSTGQRASQATQDVTDKLEDQGKKAREGTGGFDGLARSMGTSARAANAFRAAVGRISPELAAMLDVGLKGSEILSFALSKMGAVVLGISAGVAAIALAWQQVGAALGFATKQLKEWAEAEERIRQGGAAAHAEAVAAAAKAGQPPSAVGGIRTLAGHLKEAGIEGGLAQSTAAQLVDATGKPIVDFDEALRLAVAAQIGAVEPLKGITPKERERSRRETERRLGRPEIGQAVGNAFADYAGAARERGEQMAQGQGPSDIEAFVKERTGLEGEALEARTQAIIELLKEGTRTIAEYTLPGGKMAIRKKAAERLGIPPRPVKVPVPAEEWDPLAIELRRRAGERSGAAAVAPEDIPPTSQRSHMREGSQEYEVDEGPLRPVGTPARTTPAQARAPQHAMTPHPVTVDREGGVTFNNFGFVNMGRPLDKFRREHRMTVN